MRPIKLILAAGLLCAALAAGFPTRQAKIDPAEIALQAAIKTETVDGNLTGAIEQYQKLAKGSHRPAAAQALVRMGQCYEKLGDAQARNAYEKVVRDFSDQKETVASAQARLAALERAKNGLPTIVRRVWTGPEADTGGAPSWDGRYLSFTDRKTGDIALRNLSTGETRALTKHSGIGQRPIGRSIISPDGRTVAYARASDEGVLEIRVIGIDGSGQRVLHRDKALSDIELGAWSPDGSRIAAAVAAKDGPGGTEIDRIVLISVRDGAVRSLKILGARRPSVRAFSPDGRFIACDYPPRKAGENHDIFLLSSEGDREVPLVQHPADDRLLGWVPDGKGILFASDRAGEWGAWSLQVADGKSKGPAELLKPGLGNVEPLGFTRNGPFFYGVETGGMDAYIVPLAAADARLPSAPSRIDERSTGATLYPLFSPDGRKAAYLSNPTGLRWLLRVRSLETGDEREFSFGPDLEIPRTPHWAPDGRAILVSGVDKGLHHVGFYLIDILNGDTTPIMSSNPQADELAGQWTRDEKSLFLARAGVAAADQASRVLQRDPATGSELEIYRARSGEDVANLALSPGGLELAFTLRSANETASFDELWVMSVQGSDARRLCRLQGRETIPHDGLVWTPDGRQLLFAKAVETSRRVSRLELWRVSPRGQEPQKVGVLAPEMPIGDGSVGLGIHPDGKSIAFHAGKRKPEIWTMENFEPAPKTAAFLDVLNELTVEVWINVSKIGAFRQPIVTKGNYSYEGTSYFLGLTPAGVIHWGVRHGHTAFGESGDWSIDGIVTDAAIRPNEWFHIAGTIYSSRNASVYVNGVLSKTGAITQSILSRPMEPLRIGSMLNYGIPDQPFNGLIDEVAVYDRILSAEEILQHYQAGLERHKNSGDIRPGSPIH
jgi:Tol biopolymer transport system component